MLTADVQEKADLIAEILAQHLDEDCLHRLLIELQKPNEVQRSRRTTEDAADPFERAGLIADIMGAVLDEAALAALLDEVRYSDDQPRDPQGKWTSGGSASADKARQVIGRIQTGQGGSAAHQELLEHLSRMTVAQLHDLKKEHGLKASGNKAVLVAKLRERLAAKFGAQKPEPQTVTVSHGGTPTAPVTVSLTTPAPIDRSAPMAERLKAYTEGDRKVQALAEIHDRISGARAEMAAVNGEWNQFWDAQKAAGNKSYNLSKKDRDKVKTWNERRAAASKDLEKAMEDSKGAVGKIAAAADPHALTLAYRESSQKFDPKAKAAIDQGRAWYTGIVARGAGPASSEVKVEPQSAARGAYHSGLQTMRLPAGNWNQQATAVHELGHHLENRLPGAREAAQEFLAHRVGSEPLRDMNTVTGHADSFDLATVEEGRQDDFGKAFTPDLGYDKASPYYVGKHYHDGDTEILSMGFERLYRDPASFAKKDPEYVKFLFGILDGKLRK